MVRIEKARRLGKTGGLTIIVASLILFAYYVVIGWGSHHLLTMPGFFGFAFVGALIAAVSSRYGYPGAEEAAERAALVGYKASDEVKMKYDQSLSRAILLWLVLLPTYSAFFMLYSYFIVEPVGAPPTVAAYAFLGWSFPIISIFFLVYHACFYTRGRELRKFMRSLEKGSRVRRHQKVTSSHG